MSPAEDCPLRDLRFLAKLTPNRQATVWAPIWDDDHIEVCLGTLRECADWLLNEARPGVYLVDQAPGRTLRVEKEAESD